MSSKNLDLKKYSLIQLLVTIVILAVACVLQFCPTRKTEFLEGDLSISHTCGNSVRYFYLGMVEVKCYYDYSLLCYKRSFPHGTDLFAYRSIPFIDGVNCVEDFTFLGVDSFYSYLFESFECRLGTCEHSESVYGKTASLLFRFMRLSIH